MSQRVDWRSGAHFWRYLRAIGACKSGYRWVRTNGYSFDEAWKEAGAVRYMGHREWMLGAIGVVGPQTPFTLVRELATSIASETLRLPPITAAKALRAARCHQGWQHRGRWR